VSPKGTNNTAQGKAASAATLGKRERYDPLLEGEQQMFVAFSDGIFFGRIPRVSGQGPQPQAILFVPFRDVPKAFDLRVYFQRAGCQRADLACGSKLAPETNQTNTK